MPASCSTCPKRGVRMTPVPLIDAAPISAPSLICRAHPPWGDPVTGLAVWPVVKPDDVCGEHPDFEPAPPPPAPEDQAQLL